MPDITNILAGITSATTPPVTTPVPPAVVSETPPAAGESATGGEVAPKLNQYKVQLKGQPEAIIEAEDRLDAQEKYNVVMGVTSTTNPYTIVPVN